MFKRKLVLFGTGDFSDIAYQYFTYDSDYEVIAFTVHSKYVQAESRFGIPIIPFENLSKYYNPANYSFFAAVTFGRLNDLRCEVLKEAKNLGFQIASYVSSRSFVWSNVQIGEHSFIFEDNTIQPYVTIGDNVVLWSGNHVGHHSSIGNNTFVSSHVVISGNCKIEDNCFLGVNCTISNNLVIGSRSWIGPGATVTQNIISGSFVKPVLSQILPLDEGRIN